MTDAPKPLTDRTALLRNRARCVPDAMFLHQEAIDDVQDRLSMVNRPFTKPAIVTGHPAIWGAAFLDAQIVSDEDVLELQPDSHDLVIHAMCLHWANDPVGQIIQCRRALKSDGLFLAIFPGGQSLNELRTSLAEAEARLRGGLSPRVVPMGDLRDLGALLQRSGLALPVADTFEIKAEYDGLNGLAKDLRGMGEGNALTERAKNFAPRLLFTTAEDIYCSNFPGKTKALSATYELVALTGWAPHENQPQPLRPGSAQTRLSDALGTDETSLPD